MSTASRPFTARVSTAPRGRGSLRRSAELRRSAALGLAVGSTLLLVGCTSTPSSDTGSSGSTQGATASASSRPTTKPDLDSSPLSVPCTTLVTASTITSVYSNMTADATPKAPGKTDAAVIKADHGTVCSWADAASGTTMTLAVGEYSDDSLTKLENALVTSSNQVPTYDGEGYFSLKGGTGTAEAFTGSYWVVATSDDPVFGEPGGAEPLVDSAITALKARG